MKFENALYLVGTPIGNLDDLSPRAVETLKAVDFIAAEDTRVTAKLLNHFGIQKPLLSHYQHNEKSRAQEIVARILKGESGALVTDAGMPAVSDPGEEVTRLCAQNGIIIRVVPGPSAVVSAVALSGLPCGRFTFEGFLSTSRSSRLVHLQSLRGEPRTMVFYEAPHKLQRTLQDLRDCFGGDRPIALCRELTKLYEETLRMTLDQAVDYYTRQEPRGEYVLVVGGAPQETAERREVTPEEASAEFQRQEAAGLSRNAAMKEAGRVLGLSRNELYQLLLERKDD